MKLDEKCHTVELRGPSPSLEQSNSRKREDSKRYPTRKSTTRASEKEIPIKRKTTKPQGLIVKPAKETTETDIESSQRIKDTVQKCVINEHN